MWLAAFAGLAAILAYASIAAMLPWLQRRALAQVNERSSHATPTPQGAGLAVVGVAILAWLALLAGHDVPLATGAPSFIAALVGAAGLCVMGFLDDTRGVPVRIRFAAQAAAVLALVALLPAQARILPGWLVPLVVERAVLTLAGVWFINLFNFMDGIDWITFVETTTIAGGIAGLWVAGIVGGAVGPAALLLTGAMTGFAVWNRPRARIFLGDAGSQPIGLMLVWLMIETAVQGAWTAVLLISLYYWGDATVTLLLRLRRGERVWEAHRTHFYQQATRPRRFGVPATLAWIAGLNAGLIALGFAAERLGSPAWRLAAAAAGIALTLVLLWIFADRRRR